MTKRRRYVSNAEARRLLALAQELGVKPTGIDFWPDGRVRFLDAEALAGSPGLDQGDGDGALDAWEQGNARRL